MGCDHTATKNYNNLGRQQPSAPEPHIHKAYIKLLKNAVTNVLVFGLEATSKSEVIKIWKLNLCFLYNARHRLCSKQSLWYISGFYSIHEYDNIRVMCLCRIFRELNAKQTIRLRWIRIYLWDIFVCIYILGKPHQATNILSRTNFVVCKIYQLQN